MYVYDIHPTTRRYIVDTRRYLHLHICQFIFKFHFLMDAERLMTDRKEENYAIKSLQNY